MMIRSAVLLLAILSPVSSFTTKNRRTVQLQNKQYADDQKLPLFATSLTSDDTINNSSKEQDVSKDLPKSNNSKTRKVAVLLCPAQFCVPDDYKCLGDALKQEQQLIDDNVEVVDFVVAPLPRTEWIKVSQQLPTAEFWKAELPVEKTLRWYFDAIENGLAQIFANNNDNDDDINVCLIGHSIGGWVARAYLGGMGQTSTAVHQLALERISSFITLGTPHVSLENNALLDQTRGLLRSIQETSTCCPEYISNTHNIDITCVCSSSVRGNLFTTKIEELIAAVSYLPLTAGQNLQGPGDGIVPLDLAFLNPPARKVVLEECSISTKPIQHAHIVPTPWNLWDGYAPSIKLPEDEYPSYVSPGVLHQWAKYIR